MVPDDRGGPDADVVDADQVDHVVVVVQDAFDVLFGVVAEGVRHSGDAKDHISLKDNSITQSLDIILDVGHIRGITRFKLYRPNVRGELIDEIIQTEILRNLNYLAPRTI